MSVPRLDSVNYQWSGSVSHVLTTGREVRTRGTTSLEVVAHRTRVDMSRPVLTVPGRELGYKFQAGEAWWILSGDDRVETIAPYSRAISQFSDDGVVFAGAYGPKVVPQLSYAVATLLRDRQSRQAVVNIWRECPGPSRDVPCTLSLQFLVRDDELDCVATMRSSDLWLGWPYDVFNFSCISSVVASSLGGVRLGHLHLTAGSQHLYDRDHQRAQDAHVGYPQDLESPELPVLRLDDMLQLLKSMADGPGSLEGLRAHGYLR